MKFSILITSFNKGKYIEECIKSCLKQTYNNFEIIVCDNYSTDNSEEIFTRYKKKIVLLKKKKISVRDLAFMKHQEMNPKIWKEQLYLLVGCR